jgi:cystathionine gamma-lyase
VTSESGADSFAEQVIWVETPTNPMLSLVPISLISRVAKKHDIPLVVDK